MREWSDKAFVGDSIVLDFLNTGGGDTKARDFERLEVFQDVVSWARAGHVVDDGEGAVLADLAAGSPGLAEACRVDLIGYREALYRFLTGSPVADADRVVVEQGVRTALAGARLVPGAAWVVGLAEAGLSLVSFRLGLAASALLTDPASQTIRQCEACSWLFLDPSATKRRRWCSMAVCGNRAKAQRHYQRGRAGPA
jgi:predicted RNA-binding Zn ribbon-like protein